MSDDTDHHHIKPTSRCSPNEDEDKDNVVEWDEKFHRNYHHLFSNLTLKEIHIFLEIISKPGEKWTSKDLHRLRNEIKAHSEDKFGLSELLEKYENGYSQD